ncbi:MAG: hypothetical protein J6K42_05920 [Clostridia bacterium]|nr:hypothetical protein [Clostridia bacterium]
MKKNYTLKIVLAMLFVALVSLVSFVGVYKGKNLLKEYSLGKDFSQRKVVTFSVKEDTKTEEQNNENNSEEATTEEQNNENNSEEAKTEEQNNENNSEEATTEEQNNENNSGETKTEEQNNENVQTDKAKEYKNSKNIIEKRLAKMNSSEYDVRLNENTGSLTIEIPYDMDTRYPVEIVSKGKTQIVNQSTSETIIETNGFKSATARIDSTNYEKPVVLLNIKFTNDAKNTLKNANTKYTDSEGNESEAKFEFTLNGDTLYSDTAENFVNTAKNGTLDLVLEQTDDQDKLEDYYQSALTLVSIINNGEIATDYQLESVKIVSSNINIKTIIIIVAIIGVIMLGYAIYKFKEKGILPVLSLIGLVATILLVLRYTNVKITLFTILGLAVIVVANYILILKTLGNDKTFKKNFVEMLNILIPCFIVAIVLCCSPYLQLATMGMTIFWGVIVMFIYNALIVRTLIDK